VKCHAHIAPTYDIGRGCTTQLNGLYQVRVVSFQLASCQISRPVSSRPRHPPLYLFARSLMSPSHAFIAHDGRARVADSCTCELRSAAVGNCCGYYIQKYQFFKVAWVQTWRTPQRSEVGYKLMSGWGCRNKCAFSFHWNNSKDGASVMSLGIIWTTCSKWSIAHSYTSRQKTVQRRSMTRPRRRSWWDDQLWRSSQK